MNGAERTVLRLAAAGTVAFVVACSGGDGVDRNEDGVITKAGDLSVFDLEVGDCLNPDEDLESALDKIRAVPCTEEHTVEVSGTADADEFETYPGETELATWSDGKSAARFEPYVGIDLVDSRFTFSYLLPSLGSWQDEDDREVVCLVVTNGEPITESLKGTRALTSQRSRTRSQ